MRVRGLILPFAISFLLSVWPLAAVGSGVSSIPSDRSAEATVTFRFDSAMLERDYMDNKVQLARLAEIVESFRNNIDSVSIVAYASPEGNYDYNVALSKRRADALRDYLLSNWSDVRFGLVKEFAGGPDFAGLAALIEGDAEVPYRDEVLPVIRQWGAGTRDGLEELKGLRGGEPYAYVSSRYFPWLRNATTVIIHFDGTKSYYRKAEPASSGSVLSENVGSSSVVHPTGGESALIMPPMVEKMSVSPAGSSAVLPPDPGEASASRVAIPVPQDPVAQPVVGSRVADASASSGRNVAAATAVGRVAETPVRSAVANDAPVSGQDKASRAEPKKAAPVAKDPVHKPSDSKPAHKPAAKKPAYKPSAKKPAYKPSYKPKTKAASKPGSYKYSRHGFESKIGISTNLAYDLLTAVNVGLEIPVGHHWDLRADYTFPWWRIPSRSIAFQVLHADLGARYYFKPWDRRDENVFKGWFVSASAGAGYYDIAPMGDGYQGWEVMGSVGGGYSFTLGPRWRLDAALGAGPIWTKYVSYYDTGNREVLVKKDEGQKLFWLPNSAKVSLIYIIGRRR